MPDVAPLFLHRLTLSRNRPSPPSSDVLYIASLLVRYAPDVFDMRAARRYRSDSIMATAYLVQAFAILRRTSP